MEIPFFDLAEIAHDLDTSVETLIRYGIAGDLTIHVSAVEWPGKVKSGKNKDSDIIVDQLVALDPTDLRKAVNTDYTEVRKVHMDDDVIVMLDPSQRVMRGMHFVTANERRRFQQILRPMLAVHDGTLPAYFDASHKYHSSMLVVAIKTWLALCKDGEFPIGSPVRDQIMAWLLTNYGDLSQNARESITIVVNPNMFKQGGVRKKSF